MVEKGPPRERAEQRGPPPGGGGYVGRSSDRRLVLRRTEQRGPPPGGGGYVWQWLRRTEQRGPPPGGGGYAVVAGVIGKRSHRVKSLLGAAEMTVLSLFGPPG